MKIGAEIIADSKNEFGDRVTTMKVVMPRYILAELNTHRMFSKNSASSRAIPFEKMLNSVANNPFVPIAFMKDHSGMQGYEFFNKEESNQLAEDWKLLALKATQQAAILSNKGFTKQIVNRIMEPYMWHTVLITATDWENFFFLRCPQYKIQCMGGEVRYYRSRKDALKGNFDDINPENQINDEFWFNSNTGMADIHMMALAEAMWDVYNESNPKVLKTGQWHIPFSDKIDLELVDEWSNGVNTFVKVSTAMCARVSYTIVGGENKKPNYENDLKLHDRLASSGHWSPFEHCAKASFSEYCGNFKGFIQYRKTFEGENKI